MGLKSFIEHYFNAKRKKKKSLFNPDCLFDLHLIVCNDAKTRKIGYLTQERFVYEGNTLEKKQNTERKKEGWRKEIFTFTIPMEAMCEALFIWAASNSQDVQLHLLLFCPLTQQLTIFTLSVTLWLLEFFSFCLSFSVFCWIDSFFDFDFLWIATV